MMAKTKPKPDSVTIMKSQVHELFSAMHQSLRSAPPRRSWDEIDAQGDIELDRLAMELDQDEKFYRQHGYFPWSRKPTKAKTVDAAAPLPTLVNEELPYPLVKGGPVIDRRTGRLASETTQAERKPAGVGNGQGAGKKPRKSRSRA